MKRFYVVCTGVGVVLFGITSFFRHEPTKFYGIADTKETVINANGSVEIKQLPVVQGQTVKTGDTLVVLDRPELTLKINEITHMLNESTLRTKRDKVATSSELKKMRAEQTERINEIQTKISELEAEYRMKKELVATLRNRSLKDEMAEDGDSSKNPYLAQIKNLRELLEVAKAPLQARIDLYTKLSKAGNTPDQAQMLRLKTELDLLKKEKDKLIICAGQNGVIGSVNYKEGEKASAFDTILTLHEAAPSYIKGYIHENVYSHVAVGDTVTVISFSDEKQNVRGEVVGVGSRIVDYPVRLRKRQDIPIWGREVTIKIPDENSLLLGEKVLISVRNKKKKEVFYLSWTGS